MLSRFQRRPLPTAFAIAAAGLLTTLAVLSTGESATATTTKPPGDRGRAATVHLQLTHRTRLLLTVSTRHCESHRLVVRINGRVRLRKPIRAAREQMVTPALEPSYLTVAASVASCPNPVHLSSLQLAHPDDNRESAGREDPATPTAPPTAPTAPPATPIAPPAAPAPSPEAGEAPSVPGPAGERTIPIGTAVGTQFLNGGDPRYRQALIANFQSITPENEMKWETIEPSPGTFNFAPAEEILAFATAHGMTVRGHNLVWERQLPNWLTSGSWSRPELEAILHRHIEAEVSHFRGQVGEWDVVNEPFNNDGTLKSDLWTNVIGPGYIALAFRWAHEADPNATLYINDYNVDWDGPKRGALLALLTELKEEGVPVDGVGMEEHLSLSWSPTESQIAESMRRYEALGLDVEVTEMDVGTREFSGTPKEAVDEQAEIFAAAARACRAADACRRISVWGVSDAVSWLGAAEAGLPFDVNYEAKPAWLAIQSNLANP